MFFDMIECDWNSEVRCQRQNSGSVHWVQCLVSEWVSVWAHACLSGVIGHFLGHIQAQHTQPLCSQSGLTKPKAPNHSSTAVINLPCQVRCSAFEVWRCIIQLPRQMERPGEHVSKSWGIKKKKIKKKIPSLPEATLWPLTRKHGSARAENCWLCQYVT